MDIIIVIISYRKGIKGSEEINDYLQVYMKYLPS